MTFEELLKACASGDMPTLMYIKQGDGFHGVGLTGRSYTEWFHAEPGTDKRKSICQNSH